MSTVETLYLEANIFTSALYVGGDWLDGDITSGEEVYSRGRLNSAVDSPKVGNDWHWLTPSFLASPKYC